MSQYANDEITLEHFGTPFERAESAIKAIADGEGVLVVDDEDRENEGDLIYAADSMTVEQMALMIRECSGIVCLCLPQSKADRLKLPPMVSENTSSMGTAFTISIEAKAGVTTGVSAADRITTIRTAAAANAKPEDLAHPGHIFPIVAKDGGVLVRRGHTEATIDLCVLAGKQPAGVLCELTNPDGSMARLPEIMAFAQQHQMPVVTIEDLVIYRREGTAMAV